MRRLQSFTLALVAAGAMGACGGSGASTQTAHGARSEADAARVLAPTHAREAQQIVRAVQLKATDLPGFAPAPRRSRPSERERRLEGQVRRCVGGGAGAQPSLAEGTSGQFEVHAGLARRTVSSEVSVAPTPAAAAQELAQARGDHIRHCLARYLDALLGGQGVAGLTFTPVKIEHGTPPAPGVSGSFALRITTGIALPAGTIPLYFDILGFVDRSVEVSLSTFGLPLPFPAAIDEHLFSLLLQRVKGYRPGGR